MDYRGFGCLGITCRHHLVPELKPVQIEGMGGFLGSITNYLATIIQCHATVAIFSLSSALVMIGKVLVIHQDHSDEYFWGRRRCGKELGCRVLRGLGVCEMVLMHSSWSLGDLVHSKTKTSEILFEYKNRKPYKGMRYGVWPDSGCTVWIILCFGYTKTRFPNGNHSEAPLLHMRNDSNTLKP